MATVAKPLLTAEAYAQLPDNGVPTELVRGRVVPVNVPALRHGQICGKIDRLLGRFVDDHGLGHLIINDAGIITHREPDTVRGADVAYFSFQRLPPGPLPPGYATVVPELVFEVRSPTDRWSSLMIKVGEYLEAGVAVVCVVDQATEVVQIHRADEISLNLHGDDELALPDILGEFRLAVRRLFE